MSNSIRDVLPPRSVVRINTVSPEQTGWQGYMGRVFRVGYYSKADGLDCVWLVDEKGEYCETVDQKMIRTRFDVLSRSDEEDLFGDSRPVLGPVTEQPI